MEAARPQPPRRKGRKEKKKRRRALVRPSSAEVGIRLPTFYVVYFSRGKRALLADLVGIVLLCVCLFCLIFVCVCVIDVV